MLLSAPFIEEGAEAWRGGYSGCRPYPRAEPGSEPQLLTCDTPGLHMAPHFLFSVLPSETHNHQLKVIGFEISLSDIYFIRIPAL